MRNRARNQPITVAVISGLVMTTYQISFGSLILSGNLAAHLSLGIGFCLMGVVLIGAIEALFSDNPGMVAMSQVVLLYSQETARHKWQIAVSLVQEAGGRDAEVKQAAGERH